MELFRAHNIRSKSRKTSNQVSSWDLRIFWFLEILITAAKYAEDKNNVIKDVFACTKSLYAATKFDDANVGHDPDEDFMKNLGKMRHSKATLKTSQDCDDVDDNEEFGPKGVRRDFHSADQSRGRGQMDPAHSAIQRDLNKLKSVVNIPQSEGINKSIGTTSTDHVDPTMQKKKAALLRALDDLMLDSSEDEA